MGRGNPQPCRSMAGGVKMVKYFHIDGEQLLPHPPFPGVAPGLSPKIPASRMIPQPDGGGVARVYHPVYPDRPPPSPCLDPLGVWESGGSGNIPSPLGLSLPCVKRVGRSLDQELAPAQDDSRNAAFNYVV